MEFSDAVHADVEVMLVAGEVLLVVVGEAVVLRRLALPTVERGAVAVGDGVSAVFVRGVCQLAAVSSDGLTRVISAAEVQDADRLERADFTDVVGAVAAVVVVLVVVQALLAALVAARLTLVVVRHRDHLLKSAAIATDEGAHVYLPVRKRNLLLKLANLLPSGLEAGLQRQKAVMASSCTVLVASLGVVRVSGLLAGLADHLEVLALLDAVVVHVLAEDAEAAALSAGLYLDLARLQVLQSLEVDSLESALSVLALKQELLQILSDVAMELHELHSFVAEAFLGTGVAVGSPRRDAGRAVQGAAAAALDRLEHHHGAD